VKDWNDDDWCESNATPAIWIEGLIEFTACVGVLLVIGFLMYWTVQ
jgi:hypothetical protein